MAGRYSVRTRLAFSVILVLIFVFAVVALSFNLIVGNYIESRARRQLSEAQEHVNRDVFFPREDMPEFKEESSGTMQRIYGAARRASFVAQVQTVAVTPDYQLVYDGAGEGQAMMNPFDLERQREVLDALREQGVDITGDEVRRVSAKGALLYLVTMPFEAKGGEEAEVSGARLLLYTDMTDVASLSSTINGVLAWIVVVTALVSAAVVVLLSGRIARPIRALSDFAEALGRNDFTRQDLPVHDRELVELLGAMNHAAEKLDSYDKEQKTFFQNVSHELRTPLMSVKGYAEGIALGVFEDNADAAHIIGQEADHLTELVEDLLYISRADSLTPDYRIVPCDLRELLSNCAQGIQGVALRGSKRIEFDFPEEAVTVDCEERNLSRAVSNLLSNALRYAQQTVTIACANEGRQARIVIRDDGPGIAEEDLPHIFDRFYKGKGGKHGIGLAIAQAVVRQHHGVLTAGNTPKDGAVFEITLPASAQE